MRLITGLGRATMGVVSYLDLIGCDYGVYDDDEKKVGDLKGRFVNSLDGVDEIITSPGFSSDHPLIKKAIARGLPIIDEIEFSYQRIDGQIIAITGTNGKSTTTALIGNILKRVKRTFIGGNIAPGIPYSHALLDPPYDYYVLEVSSFQLERIKTFCPLIAILTNVSADHLNRHISFDDYVNTKFRIFENQSHSDHAVLNHDDQNIGERVSQIRATKHFFSLKTECEATVRNEKIIVNGEEIMEIDDIPIRGKHNHANVLSAVLAASLLGLKGEQLREGIVSFTGLPFRMERVGEKDGVTFINNSMCTNPLAAIASLSSLTTPYVVILGGKEKGITEDDYPLYVAKNSKFAVIIGSNRDRICEKFRSSGFDQFVVADSMGGAVRVAFDHAQPGWSVILNPGYASFGMFKDFEDRGRSFNDAVATL
ncbi:MAG TPA: UDP-N-acetylmuramoyl-L-alanine--D-glutamate ligase [bacterium (Candidatus Stahlbacteria)]|nr:UDP-N-acetylmuramoyl-L-alanine--D-glutamate ligase [Candidatus Stahlbacteria bacterium]